jgi:hypothetical protein
VTKISQSLRGENKTLVSSAWGASLCRQLFANAEVKNLRQVKTNLEGPVPPLVLSRTPCGASAHDAGHNCAHIFSYLMQTHKAQSPRRIEPQAAHARSHSISFHVRTGYMPAEDKFFKQEALPELFPSLTALPFWSLCQLCVAPWR